MWDVAHRTDLLKIQVIFRWLGPRQHLTGEEILPALAIFHFFTTHTSFQQQQPKYHIFPSSQSTRICINFGPSTYLENPLILPHSGVFLLLVTFICFSSWHFNMLVDYESFYTTPTFFAACYHYDLCHSNFFLPRVRFVSFLWHTSGTNHKVTQPWVLSRL